MVRRRQAQSKKRQPPQRSVSPMSSVTSTSASPAPSMDDPPLSDREIASLDLKSLKEKCEHLTREQEKWVRDRRRLLKNRGYAQTTRKHMTESQESLETKKVKYSRDIKMLKSANNQLRSQIEAIQQEKQIIANQIEAQKQKLANDQ